MSEQTKTEEKAKTPVDVVVGLPLLAKLFATMSEKEANQIIRGRAEDPVFLAIIARIRHWREERLNDLVSPPGPGPHELTADARLWVSAECSALLTMEQGLLATALGNKEPDEAK